MHNSRLVCVQEEEQELKQEFFQVIRFNLIILNLIVSSIFHKIKSVCNKPSSTLRICKNIYCRLTHLNVCRVEFNKDKLSAAFARFIVRFNLTSEYL